MYKQLLTGLFLFGLLCSNAFAQGLNANPVQISPMCVQDVNQFDIHEELDAIKQAAAVRDNAIKNSAGNPKIMGPAEQAYEKTKSDQLSKIKEKRRKQYMQGFEVSRYAHAWAFMGTRYKEDFRLDCPNPAEWVQIPGSSHFVVHKISDQALFRIDKNTGEKYLSNGAELTNPREENNGFTVCVHVKRPMEAGTAAERQRAVFIDFSLVTRYRYNDAIINRMLENDMNSIRARIDAALK